MSENVKNSTKIPSVLRMNKVSDGDKQRCGKNIKKIEKNRWAIILMMVGLVSFATTAGILVLYDAESVIIFDYMSVEQSTAKFMPKEPIPIDVNDTDDSLIYGSSENISVIQMNMLMYLVFDETLFDVTTNYTEIFFFFYLRAMEDLADIYLLPGMISQDLIEKTKNVKSVTVFEEFSYYHIESSAIMRIPRDIFGTRNIYALPFYDLRLKVAGIEDFVYGLSFPGVRTVSELKQMKIGYGTNTFGISSVAYNTDVLAQRLSGPFDLNYMAENGMGVTATSNLYHNSLKNLFLSPGTF